MLRRTLLKMFTASPLSVLFRVERNAPKGTVAGREACDMGSFRYVVMMNADDKEQLMNRLVTLDAMGMVVAAYDYGSDLTLADGDNLIIDFGDHGGAGNKPLFWDDDCPEDQVWRDERENGV